MDLRVPSFGESISEVLIGEWLKSEGDAVALDEDLVVIETDKISSELPSPVRGRLIKVIKAAGETAKVGEVIATLDENGAGAGPADKPAPAKSAVKPAAKSAQKAAAKETPPEAGRTSAAPRGEGSTETEAARIMPAARRLMAEKGVAPSEVSPSGPGGRVLKEDVQRRLEEPPVAANAAGREEEAVPMSPLRLKAAEHLVAAQHNAALLTTFNEIDMSAVIALRKTHQEAFQAKHGVKLGFMSFFVKATIEALKLVPQVNAEVRRQSTVFRNYFDIGIAVGGGKGLVVPVIKSAERLSFGEIELAIADFAERAKANKLKIEELQGGTFTISNGGIYGSMLSTPIVNAPQSGILGLHAIKERAVVIAGEIVARPMMYVALTYDHRVIDGRESVRFLARVKECIEEPSRILLET